MGDGRIMDMMTIRKMVMAQMAQGNNVRIQQGTFVGEGNQYQTIACPFEPDVILVDCPDVKDTNIGAGIISLVSVKGFGANSIDWPQSTSTEPAMSGGIAYYNELWSSIWDYSNNQMKFGRSTSYARYKFISGATYNYTFIKYTT